jgi:hypothetical protein
MFEWERQPFFVDDVGSADHTRKTDGNRLEPTGRWLPPDDAGGPAVQPTKSPSPDCGRGGIPFVIPVGERIRDVSRSINSWLIGPVTKNRFVVASQGVSLAWAMPTAKPNSWCSSDVYRKSTPDHFSATYRYSIGLEIRSVVQMSAIGIDLSANIFLAVWTILDHLLAGADARPSVPRPGSHR